MADELFRKKSMEKINSPENLNEYIRVANPGVWVLLVAILILLVGFCTWGVMGQIKTSVPAQITVTGGQIECSVRPADMTKISSGMSVEVGEEVGKVDSVDVRGGTVTVKISLPDGVYEADIITERFAPLSLILN